MADRLAMARSFYSWVAKIELTEGEEYQDKLPKMYPTSVPLLCEISRELSESFSGTKYQERADYWVRIFESFQNDPPLLDEGVRRAVLDFLKKLFPYPRVQPPAGGDEEVIRKTKKRLSLLRSLYERISKRGKEFPPYQSLVTAYRDEDMFVMGKVLGYGDHPAPPEEMTPENRRKWQYQVRIWGFLANPFSYIGSAFESAALLGALGAGKVLAAIETLIALILFWVTRVYGERVAREVYPEYS